MPQEIKVTITPTGETTVEAIGFRGKACQDATKALEQALGAVKSVRRKPEFHASAAAAGQQHTGH